MSNSRTTKVPPNVMFYYPTHIWFWWLTAAPFSKLCCDMVWPRKVRLLPNDRRTSQNCHDLSSHVGLLPPPVRSHLPSQYNGSSMSTSTSGVRRSTSVVRSPPNPWPQVKPGHSELDIVGALGGKQSPKATAKQCRLVSVCDVTCVSMHD